MPVAADRRYNVSTGTCTEQASQNKTACVICGTKDAKFIGSSIGGAYVIIRNKLNQQILAEGRTKGTPGNTKLIMEAPHTRHHALADDQTAKFLANIDIDEPVFITVEVTAPLNHKQSQIY